MTDDPTRLPTPEPDQPEDGGHRLRKVLGAVDDLEPPRDDLFAQRALLRGRARTSRRRNGVLGAAAALVVVGAVGGAWVAGQQGGASTSAGSAVQERAVDSAGGQGLATDSGAVPDLTPTSPPTGIPKGPALPGAPTDVPGARDGSAWFAGPSTPQRTAFESIEPRLTSEFADVFGGAYAASDGTGRIVVTVTRSDPALEALVTGAMPSPGDVEFATVANSYAVKRAVADQIVADARQWRAQGVDITGVRIDARSDRVVVAAAEGLTPGVLARHYGPGLVSVEVPADTGKLPDGTISTPQR
jgi:hypothetical protein